jgi:hypothetical protein
MVDPTAVQNTNFELLQSCFVFEGENQDIGTWNSTVSDVTYSDGSAGQMTDLTTSVTFEFSPEYEIASGDATFAYRADPVNGQHPAFDIKINGTTFESASEDVLLDGLDWATASIGETLSPGTNQIEIDATGGDGDMRWDVIAVFDGRFNHDAAGTGNSFDNTVHQDNGYLDDPQLYPSQFETTFNKVTTQRGVKNITLETTWNDTTNNQQVALSQDDSTYQTFDNTANASFEFSNYSTETYVRVRFSRFPVGSGAQSATPRFGYNGQVIRDYELFGDLGRVDINGIGKSLVSTVVPEGDATGNTLSEGGQKDSGGDLLTHSLLAPFDVVAGMQIRPNEQTDFDVS